MKPALRLPLALAAVAVGAYVAYSSFHSQAEEDRYEIERTRLKREFVERLSVPRGFGPDRQKEWTDEVKGLLRWYFDGLQELQNRHPGVKPPPLPEPGKFARPEDEQLYKSNSDYVKRQLDALRDGKYEPLWGGADGGLHIDLLAFDAAERPGSKERVPRIEFALWGVPRRVQYEAATRTSRASSKADVPVTFKDLAFKFYGEAKTPATPGQRKPAQVAAKGSPPAATAESGTEGKLIGGMNGGEPDYKMADPERYFEDFPPGVIFGTWYAELFPPETTKVEITLTVVVNGMGNSGVTANYKWELPARDEWKLRPGEVFKAEVKQEP